MNDSRLWDGSPISAFSIGTWLGKDTVLTVEALRINLGKNNWLAVYSGDYVVRDDLGNVWVERALF